MTLSRLIATILLIIKARINNQITSAELRVIDENGENLGVMSKEAALSLAQQKSLDLVEITSTTNPPIAKIISFDKYRYQAEKEAKKKRATQKIQEQKQIQISVGEAKNDLERKAQRIKEFLAEGHQIEIFMVLRGRQKANKDWALGKLGEFLKMIPAEYKIVMNPSWGGKGFLTHIAKK